MQVNDVFIIVPAYNENNQIRQTVRSLLTQPFQVVVVDDGSREEQASFLKGLPVVCIRHTVNLGQGAALQTGTDFALSKGANFIVHFDADGQHNPKDLHGILYPLLRRQADITIGSRFLLKESAAMIPFSRKIILFLGRIFNFMYTGLWFSDAHNGLRAFTKDAARYLRITENRMAHASEILYLIRKHRLKALEIPVTILYTEYSIQKGQKGSNGIRIAFDLLLNKLFR
jgi:glycosyltransferase involved in cell wall biosynthesis